MYLHRKQFVIGVRQFILNQTWKVYPLSQSTWLSCCRELRITQAQDANGQKWYILGLAIETLAEKLSPEEEIKRTQSDRIPKIYSSWVGRWILVGNGQIHLDASGLLGCFYGKDSSGHIWASSSVALLRQIIYADRTPKIDSRRLSYELGISWYTPPSSRIECILRLLPSQVLDWKSGSVSGRPLLPEICLNGDYDLIIEQIQQILVTSLKRLASLNTSLWLGLTAGYDSRLMLALCQAGQIEVKPFTRIAARMSVADRLLPPKLANTCGYSHIFLHRKQRFPERQSLVDSHSGGQISLGDAEPLVRGDRDGLQGIGFGGHGFALASGFYKLRELPEKPDSAAGGAEQIAALFQEPTDSSATGGLREWLSWILAHPEPNLDWRDRFFLEQRQAGWLSTKEQVYDLEDLERFPILNSAYLYSLMLSVKPEQRIGSEIQRELIHRINPKLGKYPYNPDDMYFGLLQVFKSKGKYLPKYLLTGIGRKIHGSWSSLRHKL